MEGKLDQQTGEYAISWIPDKEEQILEDSEHDESQAKKGTILEPRTFMFCNYLHHPGLANIQYKTFFHMCRLESISFDMESRSGSTFCLYDCLASGVIGMLTIGVHRKQTTKFMMDALNFVQNQVSARVANFCRPAPCPRSNISTRGTKSSGRTASTCTTSFRG